MGKVISNKTQIEQLLQEKKELKERVSAINTSIAELACQDKKHIWNVTVDFTNSTISGRCVVCSIQIEDKSLIVGISNVLYDFKLIPF